VRAREQRLPRPLFSSNVGLLRSFVFPYLETDKVLV
jgi:hypothetical protein